MALISDECTVCSLKHDLYRGTEMGLGTLLAMVLNAVSIAAKVKATHIATAMIFCLFRFIRWSEPPTSKALWAARTAAWCFILFSAIEVSSNCFAMKYGDCIDYAQAGAISAALTGLSNTAFWLVMTARNLRWKRNIERDSKRVFARAFAAIMIVGPCVSLMITSGSFDDPTMLRGWEFVFLSIGVCGPFIAGKGFTRAAMQVRPWLA